MAEQMELFAQEPFSVRVKIDEAVLIFRRNYWDKLPYGKNSPNICDKICKFFRGHFLDTISKADVERMRQFYSQMGYSQSTINKIHMTLSRIYTKFEEYKEGRFVNGEDFSRIVLPSKNPASLVPRVREKPKPEIEITLKRKKILCGLADPDLYEIIDTLWWSMLRPGDLFRITDKNVNISYGTITGTQNKSITTNNPSGLSYMVSIPADRIEMIKRRIESAKPGTPIFRRVNIQKRWEKLRKIATKFDPELGRAKMKEIRDGATSYLLDNNFDAETIRKKGGWSSYQMIPHYDKRGDRSMAHASESLAK